MGSGPAQVFALEFIKEDLTLQSPVCNAVGTTSASAEFLHLLPKDGKPAIIKSNKFSHSVNVINNELSSYSDLRLTK